VKHVQLLLVAKSCNCHLDARPSRHRRQIFRKVGRDFESQLLWMDGEGDHVHLLGTTRRGLVFSLVNSRIGASSYVLLGRWPRIGKCDWNQTLWSPSYFAASCGGARLERRKCKIEQQAISLFTWLTPA
jgi:putative transposase